MMAAQEPQFDALRGRLQHDVALARYTSWRCGGRADRLYVPTDREDLAALVRQLGGEIHALAFLIELEFLSGRQKLGSDTIFSVLKY